MCAPDEPLDAAEFALRLTKPVARATAVVSDGQTDGIAGDLPQGSWAAAAGAAKAAGKSF